MPVDTTTNVDVAFAVPVRTLFTYRVPNEFASQIRPGVRVRAPWGTTEKVGVVLGPAEEIPEGNIKAVSAVLDSQPIVPESIIELARWVSDYYFCSVGETLLAAAGPLWRVQPRYIIYAAPQRWEMSAADLHRLPKSCKELLAQLPAKLGLPVAKAYTLLGRGRAKRAIERLLRDGWIEQRTHVRIPPIPRQAVVYGIDPQHVNDLPDEVTSILSADTTNGLRRGELARKTKVPARKITEWMRDGYLRWHPRPYSSESVPEINGLSRPLTEEQAAAVQQLEPCLSEENPRPVLLFGVTGSGKTRVYMELADRVLAAGKRVLVLVPEITLAQTARIIWDNRYPGRVAMWHSGMVRSERYWTHRKVLAGEYSIVIGARSAVYAPLADVGMIVVDEEHAESYKQSEPDPRYHARDVAVVRAQQAGGLCVLGSATPAVESFTNARNDKYQLVTLKRRIPGRSLPIVHLVDLAGKRVVTEEKEQGIFTEQMIHLLEETLTQKQQAILFLNRRGHSTMVTCSLCGWRLECPNCGITLTYHLSDRSYRCHLCEYQTAAQSSCPNCGNHKFGFRGVGTQKVEQQLQRINDAWRIQRLDTDTLSGQEAAGDILARFGRREIDILVGTQMVAKGLDFAGVGLVGVVWADRHLSFPDFRSEEKTFQLVTQVSGRSGRGVEAGKVVVQTFHPEHPLIELAAAQDYVGFFDREVGRRQELSYPPYTRLIRLEYSSPESALAYELAREAVADLDYATKRTTNVLHILGPAPAPIVRVRRRYRWHILLKVRSVVQLLKSLNSLFQDFDARCRRKKDARFVVDVDPIDFF